MYPPESIPLPPKQPNLEGEPPFTEQVHREMIAHYYAATTFMDVQVGKVLDALGRTGLARSTIVVLFGDQGYCLGERDWFFSKGNLWERSLLVPLIFAAPGCPRRGAACDRPVALLDMYPTLAEMCGLPQPASGLDGRSFRALLHDEGAAWRDYAVSYNYDKALKGLARTVRTAHHRYTEKPDGTPVELIDYRSDPYEWHNLVGQAAHAQTQARLKALLRGA
jgi:uncharacterized sulfatase